MTNKEYLSQVYHLELKIKQLQLRSEEFERLSNTVTSSNYDGIRVDGTHNQEVFFRRFRSEVYFYLQIVGRDIRFLFDQRF